MRPVHEVAAVRAAEAAAMARLPEGALMQRAAAGLARRCTDLLRGCCGRVYGAHVVLLVGSGDNGGDALYAGARLASRGAEVRAVLVGDRCHQGGLGALQRAGGTLAEVAALDTADLVVDGVLGIGGHGALRPAAAELARAAAASGAVVVAVDLPSGVDADTGAVPGSAVRADVTVTFGTRKPCHVLSPALDHCGLVECLDIGLTDLPAPRLGAVEAADVERWLPRPPTESDKYSRGVVGVVAGSDTYTGAAVLATGGAIAGGAGMVRFASTRHPAELVRRRWPEVVVTVVEPGGGAAVLEAGTVQAWVVGPGLGTGADAEAVLEAVLSADVPVLVDADGLTVLARRKDLLGRAAPTLLTPHAGEFARLDGASERADVEADRLTRTRRLAGELGATVLLKGSTTVVAAPDGEARVSTAGTPYLGTAGSGDVLSGACGALLAAGVPALEAGAVGAFLHGVAGSLASEGGVPISAVDVLEAWGDAVRALRTPAAGD